MLFLFVFDGHNNVGNRLFNFQVSPWNGNGHLDFVAVLFQTLNTHRIGIISWS